MVESMRKQEDPGGHYILRRMGQFMWSGGGEDLKEASLRSDERGEWMQERRDTSGFRK